MIRHDNVSFYQILWAYPHLIIVELRNYVTTTCLLGKSRFQKWKIRIKIGFTIGFTEYDWRCLKRNVWTPQNNYLNTIKTRCSPRTRMQSRRTLLWNKLFEQSWTISPCYRTTRSAERKVWSVESKVETVECRVWSVVWSVQCKVWSVKCGV